MKIGILTLPFNNNYGGYLQAYALMTILKGMGHEVELIYRRHNRRPLSYRIQYFIKTFIKIICGMEHGPIIANQEKEYKEQGELMLPFVEKYISPKTKPLFSTSELKDECTGRYDAIVVGSDQIWRPDYVKDVENYFLDFVENDSILKISYAASFGVKRPEFTLSQKQKCGRLIELFDRVSVREDSGLEVLETFHWKTRCQPTVVLDPTMLLSKSHYESLIAKQAVKRKYVLSYVLDDNDNVRRITKQICNIYKMDEKRIFGSRNRRRNNYKMPSIETWLETLNNAEFLITDSFHGMVFSIIFNIPFIVYANKERGIDRFETLLRSLGLMDRLADSPELCNIIARKMIQWDLVNQKLDKLRENSSKFLHETCRSQ